MAVENQEITISRRSQQPIKSIDSMTSDLRYFIFTQNTFRSTEQIRAKQNFQ